MAQLPPNLTGAQPLSALDRRFAGDLKFLLARNGAEGLAAILIDIANTTGFRGLIEERLHRAVRLADTRRARRPQLTLVVRDRGEGGP